MSHKASRKIINSSYFPSLQYPFYLHLLLTLFSVFSMEFMSPLIGITCGVFTTVSTKISDYVNLKERVQSLIDELQKLRNIRDDLKRQVDQADLEELRCTSRVKGWLERVDVLEKEAGLITDEFGRLRRCFWCCCGAAADCSSRWKMGSKISRLLMDIGGLKEEGDSVVIVANGSLCPPVKKMPCRPLVGQKVLIEKVQQFLKDDEGIIGIYGLGGAGKTTLLKTINNEFLTQNHDFDVVIWMVVSKIFIAENFQKALGERMGLPWEDTESQEQRAMRIYRIMMRMKFLLLLDDVWEGLDLEKIGIPLPDKINKCKILLTARSKNVCSDMDAHQKLKVEFLNENESWQVFSQKVGNGGAMILDSPSIQPYAEIIIRKCGGLPLALITMGRAMDNKQTEEEWQHAVEVLNHSPSEMRGMPGVFSLLKFSYDSLDNEVLRSCFLYCSLFPEDYSIDKEQLVQCWVGEGFLIRSYDGNVLNKGYAVIGDLKIACLLEDGEEKTQVKMHNVVRSFALWIASDYGTKKNNFLVQTSAELTEAPEVEHWKGAQRISLVDNGITELSEVPVCPNLSTLLLQLNISLYRIQTGFFQYMPVLRVLDLSLTSISEIPASIGELVQLWHLDLSGTKVITLPKELSGLTNLEHLDLQRTHSLSMIPPEAISGLSKLKVLNLYYSYKSWEVEVSDVSDGERRIGFADLKSLKQLMSLGITVTELTSLRRLSCMNTLLKCIQYLYIKDCRDVVTIQLITISSDGKMLRRLSIGNCCDLQRLVVGEEAGNNWLPSLEMLTLDGLPNLFVLWKIPVTHECLRNLRSINIQHCHKLKNVSWAFRLPKLEEIHLYYCHEMTEVVWNITLRELTEFPSLKTVALRDLPELKRISRSALAFPCLQRIDVIDCPKLKKLPFKAHNFSTLPTVYGDKEWWDGLEWDDAATASAFLPHFMST